ncbi:glutathione S-transferase family protein [Paraburkholderia sp. ZP32-5]|uniref:glutathione S-transferase family protein n=1 Tax=Paraburkholderia sp. ZP32-5 TaxID=2883245 RepID=UPI001F1D87EB|nr:glutathione S-transferase family protein [Paraburkholderia sp. ZP32-5]
MSVHQQGSTSVLELHGARTGNCLRAAIALNEAGLSYRIHHVDLRGGEQRSEPHLALNPRGKVPVLVIPATLATPMRVITQSNAILFYAAEHSGGRLLPAEGNWQRTTALEAFFHFTTDVIALNGAAFGLQKQGHADAAAELTDRYLAAIDASECLLSDAGFMGSDDFSIADIAAFTIIQAVNTHVAWTRLPRLSAWRDRIAERPAVRDGTRAFDKT